MNMGLSRRQISSGIKNRRPISPPRREQRVFTPAQGYDLAADHYDEWIWQRVWHAVEWPHVVRALRDFGCQRGSRILDVGTGTGTYLKKIVDLFDVRKPYGVDVSERMLAVADRKLFGSATLKLSDVRKLPFKNSSFDFVLFCRVGTHLVSLNSALSEIGRVLSPGGFLIISDLDPRHDYEFTSIPVGSEKIHIETYKHTLDEWKNSLRPFGLRIVRSRTLSSNMVRLDENVKIPSSLNTQTAHPLSFMLCARKLGYE